MTYFRLQIVLLASIAGFSWEASGQQQAQDPAQTEEQFDQLVIPAEAEKVVRELAKRDDPESTRRLIDFALGKYVYGFPWPSVQAKAMQALVDRGYSEAAPVLGSLLRPDETLEVRLAAAKAILSLGCDSQCMRRVLHYLERVHAGEKNLEEVIASKVMANVGPDAERLGVTIKTGDQQAVYDVLHSVMQANAQAALRELLDVYGVGTGLPSLFALRLLEQAQVPGACLLLVDSKKDLVLWRDEDIQALDAALRNQGCSAQTGQ